MCGDIVADDQVGLVAIVPVSCAPDDDQTVSVADHAVVHQWQWHLRSSRPMTGAGVIHINCPGDDTIHVQSSCHIKLAQYTGSSSLEY